MTRIEVHIDQLVLEGVDRRHIGAIQEAVQAELGRLLGNRTTWADHRVRKASAEVHSGLSGAELGRSVARSVYGVIPHGR
ncbi:hypothetical protein NLX83_33490 [Allokutzneria sp. A3M-2-11 16]|uniref:hypothetical protein n=1 Tax=Allokutzneria sp. A3M-2-11 16 TaxID=2962043 RepID=UPI0020B73A83|nr:hypothetical protein [Allokutzneria sp. A3M-2-11 16]MCP3804198.1 hypothetical protein [Allokutzneria sp. A3M-2-11 16]